MIELKTLRKSTHLTQSEFADILKVPVSTYSKWEQGINKPADSQVFLMCNYLYKNGYIKTYLNDPHLSLTEMGLIMSWVRYDSVDRYIANKKSDICFYFGNFMSKEEADEAYRKLNKRYIISRKLPKLDENSSFASKDEMEVAFGRIFDNGGMEILPYDAGALRAGSYTVDTFFFFSRLSSILDLGKNKIYVELLDDCHCDYFIDSELSIEAKAIMNCLYYKYSRRFPLAFDVNDLIKYYGEEFYSCIDELIRKGYITLMESGFYEFNTELKNYKYGARFYIHSKLFERKDEIAENKDDSTKESNGTSVSESNEEK